MPQLSGNVGPQFQAAGTQNVPVRLDQLGAMVTSGLRGKYAELAARGQLCSAYSSAIATSLPSTSTVGTMIWNAPGSGLRVELLRWVSQIVATSATCTGIGIAVGYQTTTPTATTVATTFGLTLVNGIALAVPNGIFAYNIATVLTAPIVVRPLHHNTAAINTVGMEMMTGEFDGEIVLNEGAFAVLVAHGAAAAASGHTAALTAALMPTR